MQTRSHRKIGPGSLKDRPIVLVVRIFSPYGGTENDCFRLYRFLQSKGYDVTVVCGVNRTAFIDPSIKEIGLLRPGRFLKTLSFYHRADRYISQHCRRSITFAFVRVPGCHVYRIGASPHLDFIRLSMKGYDGWHRKGRKAFSRVIRPVNWLIPALERKVFSDPRTKVYIAVSEMVKKHVMDRYALPPEKLVVIANGVDLEKFHPGVSLQEDQDQGASRHQGSFLHRRHRLADQLNIIGFCATNFELKGLRHLIEAMPLLPAHFHLLVAGGRSVGKYKQMAEKLGVEYRIVFLGKMAEMKTFYSNIDMLCHPSFYDSFGNVIAEALAMNLPVVTSNHVGAADLISENRNGFVVNDITPENLAASILKASELEPGNFRRSLPSDKAIFSQYLDLIGSFA